MADSARFPPRMMLGFVVRRCAHAIGHDPTAAEFAAWANTYRARPEDPAVFLFGRAIGVAEAEVILRHPSREVASRSLRPFASEPCAAVAADPGKVTDFSAAAARLRSRAK